MRTVVLLIALLVAAALPATATATNGAAYLARSLGADGCAREPGGTPSVTLTGWVALGLVAGGHSARSASACIERNVRSLRGITDVQLAVLALRAAGRPVTDVGGRNLLREIIRARRGGRIGPTVASTQFGALALRASGRRVPIAVRRQLIRDQNSDGSWSAVTGDGGDSNLTASALQALVASGVPRRHPAVRRGVSALLRFRTGDGGYSLVRRGRADAQSTAWAIQGLAAVGRRDSRAERYLASLRRSDGSYAYSRGRALTPVWVTAQVVPGLARRPLPLR